MKIPPHLHFIVLIALHDHAAGEVASMPNPLDFPGQGPVGPTPGGPGGLPIIPQLPPVIIAPPSITSVDTTTAWNGSSSVGNFGVPHTATYGQTITVPVGDSTLHSFAFQMNLPASTSFRGHVFAWNGSSATGSALYQSGVMATTGNGSFEEVTFNTGPLVLLPGSLYVLFASVSQVSGSAGVGSWGQPGSSDPYTGGGFVFLNNANDASQWTTTPWSQNFLGTGADLAFKASFSNSATAAPEPTAALLSLLSITPILLRRRR